MTQEQIAALRSTKPREFDAAVAQHVMGWRVTDDEPDGTRDDDYPCVTSWWVAIDGHPRVYNGYQEQWRPSSDTAADYATLKLVRKTWDVTRKGGPDPKRLAFLFELNRILWINAFGDDTSTMPTRTQSRMQLGDLGYVLEYLPGDYSAAALAVVLSAR